MRSFYLLLAASLSAAPSMVYGQNEAERTRQLYRIRGTAAEEGAIDPSLRSLLATPNVEFSADMADDRKTATAKAGFEWGRGLTGEIGFTGAFDKSADRTPITSLRALTPGSSGWVAVTYKKYGVRYDWLAEQAVCRQAAWALDVRFPDFDCDERRLSDQSFEAALAAVKRSPSLERGICQQFVRAMHTAQQVVEGKDLSTDCEASTVVGLQRHYGERFTLSYADRYGAARTPADALEVCNEFRRSRGLPPEKACAPADFTEANQALFKLSWKARFASARSDAAVAICDAYRRAKGQVPTGEGDCDPAMGDPVFTRSFRARYAATYQWLKTPVYSVRVDYARPSFKFLDLSLSPRDDRHASYSVSGTAGVLFVNDTLVAATYRDGTNWKAKDKVTLCRPVGGTDAMSCRADVIMGAPDKSVRRQFEAQIKGYLRSDVGAAIYLTRDLKGNAWGVEVPVYFMKAKSGGLAGGLVFSYRSDEKAYDVSVFVGQVFSVFH